MDRTYIVLIRTQDNNEKETYTKKEFSTIDEARAYMHEEYLCLKAIDVPIGKRIAKTMWIILIITIPLNSSLKRIQEMYERGIFLAQINLLVCRVKFDKHG